MPHRIVNLWDSANDLFSSHYGNKPSHGSGKTAGGFLFNHSSKSPVASDPLSRYFDTGTEAGQFDALRFDSRNATQIRVNDALKAGINPLAALGVSSNVSPTMMSTGANNHTSGGRFSNIAKTLRSFIDQKSESNELDLESKRIQNRILREELNLMRQPGNPGVAPQEQPPIGTDSMLYKPVFDIHGRPRLMVNQDVTENDSDNAAYRSSLATAVASGQINPVTGRIRSRQLRMKIADDYYRATGRPLTNWDEMYISPSELAFITLDEIRGR